MTYTQQQTAVTYIDWDFVSWITEDYREKTAQISCNTVTQYCSVFCLTAVIVSYCGCGWFRFNLQRRSLAGRVARFWCGMSLSPSNMHPFVYQRSRHRCRSVRTEKTIVVSLLWSYMQPWSKESFSSTYELGHWIRSVSREPLSVKQFCGGANWICKFMKQTERHLWDKTIPWGRWAHLRSPHHVWRWTCCVLLSDRARGMHYM